ncbi:MAG: elongation factor G [Pirellulaceae bacterium]|nr:elongation factor G [Pirellulaceae bacterium]
MTTNIQQIRNIGIIAHIDAGKTTVTENMLFCSGSSHRAGKVDQGTTVTDSDEEEQQRGITIYSACVKFQWNEVHINLLDTPGHVDFTAEVERCLRVLDGGVVVFSAREGVEAQSETVWRQANKYHVPRMIFINKLDREGARFEGVLDEIRTRLNGKPLPLQIPVGLGPEHIENSFRGIIDLITMEMVTFDLQDKKPLLTRSPIPKELADEAAIYREQMLEALYDYSNEMTELALAEEPIPRELIESTIRKATIAQKIHPLFCGSALHGIGIQTLLDGVASFLPSPLDKPPIEGADSKKPEKTLKRKPSVGEPFCGLVFKILPYKTGDLYWVRIYSGQLKGNSRALNPTKEKKENITQLWQIHSSKKEQQLQIAEAGDIVGIIGPRHSTTGDTLCDSSSPIVLENIDFPETVISMAVEPDSTADKQKLLETLEMLKKQDPTFEALENEETGQMVVSGMGELHLEVLKHRLLRDFNLNVKVHKPRVSYRETIHKKSAVIGECHRQVGGHSLFAKIGLEIEPIAQEESKPPIILSRLTPEAIEALPTEYFDEILGELRDRAAGGGPIMGSPLVNFRIILTDYELNEENSNETACRIAASDAFEKGLTKAIPTLLEPVMKVEISTPEDYLGELTADLLKRRATITKTEPQLGFSTIEAQTPLGELFGYSNQIRSLSQGFATYSMEPYAYLPAPPEVMHEASGF